MKIQNIFSVVLATVLYLNFVSIAQAFPVFPTSYSLSCTGTRGGGGELSLVGRIQFNNNTTAVGSAKFVNGSIIQSTSFTASFTNGTGNAQGTTGNGIPQGCFNGSAFFSGDVFGVLSGFFGCYSGTQHGFDLTQTSSSLGAGTVLTCKAMEM